MTITEQKRFGFIAKEIIVLNLFSIMLQHDCVVRFHHCVTIIWKSSLESCDRSRFWVIAKTSVIN